MTHKVTTPSTKDRLEDTDIDDALLSEKETELYRFFTMPLWYISHDRCDLQRVARELAKRMAHPSERHFMKLERAGRYLPAFPRVVQLLPTQRAVTELSTAKRMTLVAFAVVSQRRELRSCL